MACILYSRETQLHSEKARTGSCCKGLPCSTKEDLRLQQLKQG